GPPAALLVLSAAAARTRVVPSGRPVGGALVAEPGPLHDVGRRASVLELGRHEPHVRIDVVKERLVARTQVIQAIFAVRRACEPMLRALAVAGEAHLAFTAVARKRSLLGLAEIALLG